jgi:hypothetical protein
MDLITFYLRIKFLNLFQIKNLYVFLFLLFIWIQYYFSLPHLLTSLLNQSDAQLIDLKKEITGIFLLLTIIRKIVCKSFVAHKIFPDYMPIPTLKKYILKLFIDLFTIYFLHTIVLVCMLTFYINFFDSSDIISLFLSIQNGLILSWILNLLPSFIFKPQKHVTYLLLLLIFVPLGFIGWINHVAIFYSENIYFISVYIFLIGLAFESIRIYDFGKNNQNHWFKGISNFHLTDFFAYNKPFLLSMLYAAVNKGLMLFILANGITKGIPHVMIFIFLMPTLPFAYCLNNVWGFNRFRWIHIQLATPSLKTLFWHQLKIALLPLLIDFCLFSIFLLLNYLDLENIHRIVFSYFTCLFSFFVFSFFWSLIYPKYVKKHLFFSGTGTTSIISAFITILMALSCSLLEYSLAFLIFPIIYLTIASLLIVFLPELKLNDRFRTVHAKLFKL